MRCKLVDFMHGHDLPIRQSYARRGPRLAQQIGRHTHVRQFKRRRRLLRKQRTYVGRPQRELERPLESLASRDHNQGEEFITLARRLIDQGKNSQTKNALYSLYELAVDCIPGNSYDSHTLDDLLQ